MAHRLEACTTAAGVAAGGTGILAVGHRQEGCATGGRRAAEHALFGADGEADGEPGAPLGLGPAAALHQEVGGHVEDEAHEVGIGPQGDGEGAGGGAVEGAGVGGVLGERVLLGEGGRLGVGGEDVDGELLRRRLESECRPQFGCEGSDEALGLACGLAREAGPGGEVAALAWHGDTDGLGLGDDRALGRRRGGAARQESR